MTHKFLSVLLQGFCLKEDNDVGEKDKQGILMNNNMTQAMMMKGRGEEILLSPLGVLEIDGVIIR